MSGGDSFRTQADVLVENSLHQPVEHFVSCRGKRIRAALLNLSYKIAGGQGDVPQEVSQAIEWLHAGSLVIDDIQDGSASRRGRLTMHQQLGTPLAINAGNYMYFRAMEYLATSAMCESKRCRLLQEMVRIARICHEGQALDLSARIDRLAVKDWYQVAESISIHKTGVLVELSMRLGAIAASAGQQFEERLARFGCQIGVALQMRNDLDELTSVVEDGLAGRNLSRLDDLRNGRVTWPWAWLSARSGAADSQALAARLRDSVVAGDETALARTASELLKRTLAHGQAAIKRQIEAPLRLLGEHVIDGTSLGSLRGILSMIEPSPAMPDRESVTRQIASTTRHVAAPGEVLS